ncbi:2-hydroxyacyl-CoA dehydratase family protein [Peptoniphilus sp. GNH]|nr:2-hydroxyglutaryl-CoA dehydratase, D-component [Clostridiales bacterium KA00134]UHR03223.1 2-hydroxyacyl-CoA dehydratase family protein [Peptoniphilus sp. GNH]
MKELQELLSYFKFVSNNPREMLDKYVNDGFKVIGCMPYYNVKPIISALGMIPMSIWGANINPRLAGKYSPAFTCSLSRTCLELGMNGTLDKLSAVVMPILCDTLRGEVTAWRAGINNIDLIPFVPPQNRKDSGALDFYIEEIKYVTRNLENIADKKINNKTLQEELDKYNKINGFVRKFTEMANKHLDIITASDRHNVIKALSFLTPEDAIKNLIKLIELLENEDEFISNGKKILISGIMLDSDEILNSISKSNMHILEDDLANESRIYRYDYPMASSAFESFALHWLDIKGCSLAHDDDAYARGKMLVDLAKKHDIDIVILAMMKFCDIEEYDQPYVTKMLQDNGFNVVSIDIDQSSKDFGQTLTKLQALSEI